MSNPMVVLAGGTVAAVVVITLATRSWGGKKPAAKAVIPKAKSKSKDKVIAAAVDAGDYAKAAARAHEIGDLDNAYELYLLAQQPLKAAEIALATGKPAFAAELYERAGDKTRAIVAYKLAEMNSKARELEAELAKERAEKGPAKLAGPRDRAEQAEAQWRAVASETGGDDASKEYVQGFAQTAAEAWISAGDMRRAAELCQEAGLLEFAVNLYVNALGEPGAAAKIQASRGDHKRAAELYEIAGDKDRCVDEWVAWAKDQEDPLVCLEDVERLGEEAKSRFFDAVMAERPIVRDNLDLHYRIAAAMNHDPRRAKEVIDQISNLQPNFRDVNERIEQLVETIAKLPPKTRTVEATGADGDAQYDGEDGRPSQVAAHVALPTEVKGELPVARLRDALTGQEPDLGNIEVYYRLGMALLARGRYADARTAFTQVEEACAGYRDAAARASEIEAWQRDAVESLAGRDPDTAVEGRYTHVAPLGRSELTAVFRGFDEVHEREVALKLPTDEAVVNTAFLEAFERLAHASMGLDHPNIAKMYEVGRFEGRPLVAMELVEGESVDAILTRTTRLAVSDALAIAEEVLVALGHAHDKGVLHLDVKPANVMLESTGTVKVLDFGLVGAIPVQQLEISDSPSYMAPEQLAGRATDARTDLFAVGATLFEMITGELPFDGTSRRGPAKPVGDLVDEVPPALDEIVGRAMDLDAERRFASAGEMLEAVQGLRAAIDGE